MDMNFIFSWSTRYLTRSLRSLVRYRVDHSKIKFISTCGHVISSIYAHCFSQWFDTCRCSKFKISLTFFSPRISIQMMTLVPLQCPALTIHNPQLTAYHRSSSRQGSGSWNGTEKATQVKLNSIYNKCSVPAAHLNQTIIQILLLGVLRGVAQSQEM